MEKGLTKNQILSELSRSPHGKLEEYVPVGLKAAKQEPEFLAHLIAWDAKNGQIRDAKAALPIVSLSEPSYPQELVDNSLAHLAKLNPRELLKAYRFLLNNKGKATTSNKRIRTMNRFIAAHLSNLETDWKVWQRIAVLHRSVLRELYALTHTKPKSDSVNTVLFGRKLDGTKAELPKGSLFEKVAHLKDMSPAEAAGTILEYKIPFLIAMGALGAKMKEPDLVLAMIKRMTAPELLNNVKMLEKLGIKDNPALKGAFDEALQKAQSSKKNILKATKAAEQMTDNTLKQKLQAVQEKQLQSIAVEGNWLVLGDKSGSMHSAIEAAREVAATLAKMVKGKVWLTFFDVTPQTIDVTGATLDHIKKATQYIQAAGGTSIGCGLQRMLDAKEELDGIAIISDGGDNTVPYFHQAYPKYSAWAGKEVPVYLYHMNGETNVLSMYCQQAGIDLQVFELTGQKQDYYSLPNLVATMRTNRYSLVDEIMATPLLTLDEVYKSKQTEEIKLKKEEEEYVTAAS